MWATVGEYKSFGHRQQLELEWLRCSTGLMMGNLGKAICVWFEDVWPGLFWSGLILPTSSQRNGPAVELMKLSRTSELWPAALWSYSNQALP